MQEYYQQAISQPLQLTCHFCKQVLQQPKISWLPTKPKLFLEYEYTHDCHHIMPVNKITYIFDGNKQTVRALQIEYKFLTDDLELFLSSLQFENAEELFMLQQSQMIPCRQVLYIRSNLPKKIQFESFRELTKQTLWRQTYRIVLRLSYSIFALFQHGMQMTEIFGMFRSFSFRHVKLMQDEILEHWICGACDMNNRSYGKQQKALSFQQHLLTNACEPLRFLFVVDETAQKIELWEKQLNV